MMPTRSGAFRIFRAAQIDVFLHYSWFLVAIYEISQRVNSYSSLLWNVLEYLALFVIVLLHEFGHALACRSVGGHANQIILWPLGGVAYVDPPQRPGAMLWSIAAGPLVNVVLLPVLFGIDYLSRSLGWAAAFPNAHALLRSVEIVNLIILAFNLLPIYPLDGGQILRSLLWFAFGRVRSLLIATIFGFVGVVGLGLLALWMKSFWIGIMAFFVLANCWRGLQAALAMNRLNKAPRRDQFACPSCHNAPPAGAFWMCSRCRQPFDTFETGATCPKCQTQFPTTRCVDCGQNNPLPAWIVSQPAEPPVL